MEYQNSIESIKKRALQIIEMKKAAGVGLYYLSQLSNDMGFKKGFRFENQFGLKFYELVESISEYKLETSKKDGTTRYLILEENAKESKKRPRYSKETWDAFSIPLISEEKRYAKISNDQLIYDSSPIKENIYIYEIDKKYIVDEENRLHADIIAKNIAEWLEKNSIGLRYAIIK